MKTLSIMNIMAIPYRVDPTLHGGPPPPESMGDGFEPPSRSRDPHGPGLDLATHPVEPEPPESEPAPDPAAPNPTRLPVEPEFQPQVEPVEPEDPPIGHHRPV